MSEVEVVTMEQDHPAPAAAAGVIIERLAAAVAALTTVAARFEALAAGRPATEAAAVPVTDQAGASGAESPADAYRVVLKVDGPTGPTFHVLDDAAADRVVPEKYARHGDRVGVFSDAEIRAGLGG